MHYAHPVISVIILAAGQGTRMMSTLPKVMHAVGGRPMIGHVITAVSALNPREITVVIGDGHDDVRSYCANEIKALGVDSHFAIQSPPMGTAHGVQVGVAAGTDRNNPNDLVLIVFADTPLLDPETLMDLVQKSIDTGSDVAVVAMNLADPKRYGRLVCDEDGVFEKIVEYNDASTAQRTITLCNAGLMLVRRGVLEKLLPNIQPSPETGEYYLTDLPALGRGAGLTVSYHVAENPAQFEGVNTRQDLAAVECYLQHQFRQRAMMAGVTLIDPNTVTFSFDTVLGADCIVEPNVVFGLGVVVAPGGVRIKSFSYLEGVEIQSGAVIGPFARIRPGTVVGQGAKIGNFVEIKASTLNTGVKVGHLSYIGNATIGAGTNIGAGVITCNYDGFQKWPTHIGADVFVGSNTALIAPTTVGDGVMIGAGSVIGGDIAPHSLTLTRAPLRHIENGAKKYRARHGQIIS